MSTGGGNLTQKDFYDALTAMRKDFNESFKDINSTIQRVEDKIDKTQQDVATINGQNKATTFFISTAIGVFFSLINFFIKK